MMTSPQMTPRERTRWRTTSLSLTFTSHCPHTYNRTNSRIAKTTQTRHFSKWRSWIISPWILLILVTTSGVQGRSRGSSNGQGQGGVAMDSEDDDPLSRLSRVLGIRRIPEGVRARTPPQYMTDLYRAVADSAGLTRAYSPYHASTVRSFPDRDPVHEEHYIYRVSHLKGHTDSGERVLEAEFHIFKMKPRPASSLQPPPPHHLQLRIYQVLNMADVDSPNSLRLLDSRRISTHAHGWLTFKVSKALSDWLERPETNHGLLVRAHTSQAYNQSSSYVRFAQRHQHHDSKQPILVVFTDDGQEKNTTLVSPDDKDYQQIHKEMEERNRKVEKRRLHRNRNRKRHQKPEGEGHTFSRTPSFRHSIQQMNEGVGEQNEEERTDPPEESARKRVRRGAEQRSGGGRKRSRRRQGRRKRMHDISGYRYSRRSCSRLKMYVDFADIGWSGWIISPKGYDAYHCAGLCPFPLGQSQKPTNHATVQSIVHALRVGGRKLGSPCCVPNKLFSISLLYFDDQENVILKSYDDMVAASCGCH